MNIELKNSVLNDLGFNNILNEYTKFSHSSDTTNKLLELKPVFKLDTIRENLNKTSSGGISKDRNKVGAS